MTDSVPVAENEEGLRLDRWFKRHFPQLGHVPLEKLLRSGQIRIDGRRAHAGDRIQSGQLIRIPPQLEHLPAQSTLPVAISETDREWIRNLVIYEDSSVIVLNKPSGIPTQGGSGVKRHIDGLLDRFARQQTTKAAFGAPAGSRHFRCSGGGAHRARGGFPVPFSAPARRAKNLLGSDERSSSAASRDHSDGIREAARIWPPWHG